MVARSVLWGVLQGITGDVPRGVFKGVPWGIPETLNEIAKVLFILGKKVNLRNAKIKKYKPGIKQTKSELKTLKVKVTINIYKKLGNISCSNVYAYIAFALWSEPNFNILLKDTYNHHFYDNTKNWKFIYWS